MLRARIVRAVFGIGLSMLAGIALFVLWHRDTRGVSIDGVRRSFDVVVEGGAGPDPVPLVFIFHGRNGSARAIRRRTGIDAAAREVGDRAVFVYPQGRPYLTDDFRAIHGCSTRSHEIDPHCRAYDGCREPVIQCVYPGLTHELPSNGGRELWSFLRSFSGALR